MSATRALVFCGFAYLSLLCESALAVLLGAVRTFFAAPELGLFVAVYLGLCGRGGPIALTVTVLGIGYLRDLLIGAPRGVEALSFALIALFARALHGRIFLDRFGQLAVVCAGFAMLHAALILLLASGDAPLAAALRSLPGLLLSALMCGPILLRVLRRLDQRVSPEARALRLDGDLGGAWR
jgi:rod shape-determining protein MreD